MPAAPTSPDLTALLNAWRDGSDAAFGAVIDQVYAELKVIAARRLGQLGGAVTLSPTEVLHEALIGVLPGKMDFRDRAHFFATMSLAIRAILVDHARARSRDKRGGGLVRVSYTEQAGEPSAVADLLIIEQTLSDLERLDPRCAQVVQLTYFGGLEHEEIAQVLGLSVSTVTRDLRFARGFIGKALGRDA